MMRFVQYYGRFQGLRGDVKGLPSWARTLLAILAIPGVVLIALSIVAFFVSLLALLLLTVPAYLALKSVTSPRRELQARGDVPQDVDSRPRRHVDVTIVE